MAKNKNQAKKMASKGASVKEIRKETGVSREAAKKFTQKTASRPSLPPATNGQFPTGNTAARTNPNPNTSTSRSNSPRSTPEIKGLGQGIRLAGENGLGKRDYKTIAETTGKSDDKIVGKLDKINTKLEEKGKTGIDLKSGTGNMLVRKATKSSNKSMGYRTPDFGEGAIGSTLQSMISTPERSATWIKGTLTGGREADPGFNPGGSPDKNRMIGGTVIRPNGTIANKGVGKQYELPNRFKGEKEFGPYDGMEIGPPDLSGPGPLANPNTKTWLGYKDPDDDDGDGDGPGGGGDGPTLPTGPTGPVEEVDRSASSGAGGLDLASWATGFRKARSARQKSGRPAQGLASQKKNPFKSWA
jgi:hypothetical protein